MSKRGISDVIMVVLLILIAIVAVIIVWQIIRTMASPDIETGRLTIELSIKSATVYENVVTTTVQRNPGAGDLLGVVFKFENNNMNEAYTETVKQALNEMEYKNYVIDLTGKINNANKVSIAALVRSSKGKEIIGPIIDSKNIEGAITCVPDCTGKACGTDDGCQGTCQTGSCPTGFNCVAGVCQ